MNVDDPNVGDTITDMRAGHKNAIREMLAFAAERLMDLEVEARTGVPAGARSPERLNHRNGYRERAWDTRVGRIDLAIPKLRRAATCRPFWSPGARPRRRSRR